MKNTLRLVSFSILMLASAGACGLGAEHRIHSAQDMQEITPAQNVSAPQGMPSAPGALSAQDMQAVQDTRAAEDTSGVFEAGVTLSIEAEPRQVPINRTLQCTIRISWEGDIDLIEIGEIEAPALANFEIAGTASTNRVVDTASGRKAQKEVLYTLQPKTLGMAYIEPAAVTYKDLTTGKEHSVMTQRLAVEVLHPVAEPGKRSFLWLWILLPALALAAAAAFFLLKRRAVKKPENGGPLPILEESVLAALKEQVDLKAKDRRAAFTVLSKLFRRYLSDKYGIPALEATTGELMPLLEKQGIEEPLLAKVESFLKDADVVKFSGKETDASGLSGAYTTVETLLELELSKARSAAAEREAGERKRRKKKNPS